MEQPKQPEKPPIRVLFLADFACASGFAQVAQNIAVQLLKTEKYQIDVVAINYRGMPTEWHDLYPMVRLMPAIVVGKGDMFGRQGVLDLLTVGNYDILFTLQDTFIIEPLAEKIKELRQNLMAAGKKPFKWIFYYPIDAKPMDNWITKSAGLADYPIVYTQYGYKESLAAMPEIKTKLRIIPHGVDITQFFPLDKTVIDEFRKDFFLGRVKDKFLITNVNRNQPRKDIPRTMQIFRLFKNQVPEAILYLHMKKEDVGWTIDELARHFGLIPNEDYIIPNHFDENTGVSVKILNAIYNSSQLVMTTTLGEGWGLSMTESMAAKVPVIAPNQTSLTEMFNNGEYGTLVGAGKRGSDWVALQNDNNRIRPIVDVAEYVQKLVNIRNNYKEAQDKAQKAYEYVTKNLNWEEVGKQWKDVFDEAVKPVDKKIKIGRNDPCYCGSDKKYKNCHLKYE